MSFENHHQDTLFSELVKTLVSHNCPLITRNDSWWMEELLLKPGKQRTDLLLWIIARLTNSFYPSDSDHDCTSTSTASSVSYKLPENEEGILDFLCQSAILSTDQTDYTPFLQGTMDVEKQLKYWSLLILPLQVIDKHTTSSTISAGCNTVHNIVSMENFLDTFQLTAALLPADVKSEMKNKKNKLATHKMPMTVDVPFLYDKAFSEHLSEQTQRLKTVAETFSFVYNTDLKSKKNRRDGPSNNLVDVGQSSRVICERTSAWKQDMDCLLELHRRSATDKGRHKADEILDRCSREKAYKCFQDLCQNEWR